MVSSQLRSQVLHKLVRPIVYCQAGDRHVVRVEYSVNKSATLPQSSQSSSSLRHFLYEEQMLLFLRAFNFLDFREPALNCILQHLWHHLLLETDAASFSMSIRVFVQEELESAEPPESLCCSHHNCTRLSLGSSIIKRVS